MLDIHIDPDVSLLRMGNSNITVGASVQDVLAALRNNIGKAAVEKSQVSVVDVITKGVRLKTRGANYKFQFTFHPAFHRLQVAIVENTKNVRLLYKGLSIGCMEGEFLKSSPVLDSLKLEYDTENDVYFAREKDVWFIFEVEEVEIPQENAHVDLDVSQVENKKDIIQHNSKGPTQVKYEEYNPQQTASTEVYLKKSNESECISFSSSPNLSQIDSIRDKICIPGSPKSSSVSETNSSVEDTITSSSKASPLPSETGEPSNRNIMVRKSTISPTDTPLGETKESHRSSSESFVFLNDPENDNSLPSSASPEGGELHKQSGPLSNISNVSEFERLQYSLNSACDVTNDSEFSFLDYEHEAYLSMDTVGVIDTPVSPGEDIATPPKESITPPVTERIQRPTKKVHVLKKVILFSEREPTHSTSLTSRRTDAIECVNFSFGQQTNEDGEPTGVVSRGISVGKNRALIPDCPKTKDNIFWLHSAFPTVYGWFKDVLGDPDQLHEYKHGSNHMMLFAYYRHGLDLVVQLYGKTMRVRRVILHTAYPGHPDFSLYNRCFFKIQVPYELSQKTNIPFLTTFSSLEDVEKVTKAVKSPHTTEKLCRMYMYVGHNICIKMTSKCQIATITVDPYVGNPNDIKEVFTNTVLSIPLWRPSANSYGLPSILEQVPENEEVISVTDSKTAEDDSSVCGKAKRWRKNYGNKIFHFFFLVFSFLRQFMEQSFGT